MRHIVRIGFWVLVAIPLLAQSTQPAQSGDGTELKGNDRKFAILVAQTDLAEIQVGNLALQKGNSPQVKQIAQKLVEDHTKTSTALKGIAAAKGLTLPADTDPKHKAVAAKLESATGEKFDKEFLSTNSKDHHKVMKEFEKEANSGQDPELRQFASQFLPAIKEHSTMMDRAHSENGAH
jgi:putative membrane protein